MNSKIKTKTLRLTAAAGLLLGTAVAASAAGNSVITFSVDMTAQIQNSNFTNGVNAVNARGTLNGYGTAALTNNMAALNPKIYSCTCTDTVDANGSTMQYKYCIDGGGWESLANNRQWGLPKTSGGSLVLPTYY